MERCKEEHAEEQRERVGTSEPLRGLLHGVPGAGKSQFLLWVKEFFLQVCAWQHGVQFVFLASQNTMCSLIGGFTLHSWGQIVFRQKDGTPANTKKRRPQKNMSEMFLKLESLRWLFIDETSTASTAWRPKQR